MSTSPPELQDGIPAEWVHREDQPVVACRNCSYEFTGAPKWGFAGLQTYSCPSCGKSVRYPLKRGWRTFWWISAVLTAAGGVWANLTLHEGYSWIPAGIGLFSFIALSVDVGVRYRIDRHRAGVLIGSDDSHTTESEGSSRRESPASASPGYIAALTITITIAAVASVLGAVVVVGLNNAYSTTVVLQRERAATTQSSYSGAVDLVYSSDYICGDGDDYNNCLNMHIAMYNSVCVTSARSLFNPSKVELSSSANNTCDRLDSFIEDIRARAASCGYGCTTQADEDGRWGWAYLRPSPVSVEISNDNRLPRLTYLEHCLFDLGFIKLGACDQ